MLDSEHVEHCLLKGTVRYYYMSSTSLHETMLDSNLLRLTHRPLRETMLDNGHVEHCLLKGTVRYYYMSFTSVNASPYGRDDADSSLTHRPLRETMLDDNETTGYFGICHPFSVGINPTISDRSLSLFSRSTSVMAIKQFFQFRGMSFSGMKTVNFFVGSTATIL